MYLTEVVGDSVLRTFIKHSIVCIPVDTYVTQ